MTSRAAFSLTGALPLELQILCVCARLALCETDKARLLRLLSQSPDWERLLQQAHRHRLMPLLHRHLSFLRNANVPPDIQERLRQLATGNARRNLAALGELRELQTHFQAAGIDALFFKGPVQGITVYGDVALRQFADLDVLVRPQDAHRAMESLDAAGYCPSRSLPAEKAAAYRAALVKLSWEYSAQKPEGLFPVELHWRLFSPAFDSNTAFDFLWERSVIQTLRGEPLRTFSDEDLLLFLCGHGGQHAWERLELVCGVAELIRQPTLDWDYLSREARRSGKERVLALGLLLARELLGAAVPEGVCSLTETCVTGSAAAALAQYQKPVWDKANAQDRQWLRQFNRQLLATPIERVRYSLWLVFSPMLTDWEAFPLPTSLFPLYSLLRPLRLLNKYRASRRG